MKRRLCVVCMALLIWVGSTLALHGQTRLVLSGAGEQEDPPHAMSERILTEAYSRIGVEIEVQRFPGPRGLFMANEGKIDGELFRGGINTDEFPDLIQIPVPIMYGELVVFTISVDFEVDGWESLRPYNIGIQLGNKEIEAGTRGMQVEPLAKTEQLLLKLVAGRNDIVVVPRIQGMEILKELNSAPGQWGVDQNALQRIAILEPPIQRDPLFHYLHKKHAALVPKITAALQEMADEGLIQRITEEVDADFSE